VRSFCGFFDLRRCLPCCGPCKEDVTQMSEA
jgi:hypothetical protein